MIWYETFISTCVLASYYFLYSRFSKHHFLSDIFITISTFIKPTSFVFIIPWIIFGKQGKKLLLTVSLSWALVLLFYSSQGGLQQLYDGLFGFNQFLLKNYFGIPMGDLRFLVFGFCILLFSYFFARKEKELLFLL